MKVLLTRPAVAAAKLKAELEARRHDVILAPMLRIELLDFQLGDDPIGAIAITSANAIPALAGAIQSKNIPVFAVGRSSADAAISAGFLDVRAADGDVGSLCRLLQESHAPADGTILHLSGEQSVGDLSGALASAGYDARVVTAYRAIAASALPEDAVSAIAAGEIDAVLFFSPRTARTLLSLLRSDDRADEMISALKGVRAIAISDAVAEALEPDLWRAVDISGRKSARDMLETLDANTP